MSCLFLKALSKGLSGLSIGATVGFWKGSNSALLRGLPVSALSRPRSGPEAGHQAWPRKTNLIRQASSGAAFPPFRSDITYSNWLNSNSSKVL